MTQLRSQNPTWQKVAGAYTAVGVTPFLDDEVLPGHGVVYTQRMVALAGDSFDKPERALHDLGHILLTPRERRESTNYGLGPSPHGGEPVTARCLVGDARIDAEEEAASVLHILLTQVMFGTHVAAEVAEYLSFDRHPLRPENFHRGVMILLARARVLVPGTLRLTVPRKLNEYLHLHGLRAEELGPSKSTRTPFDRKVSPKPAS